MIQHGIVLIVAAVMDTCTSTPFVLICDVLQLNLWLLLQFTLLFRWLQLLLFAGEFLYSCAGICSAFFRLSQWALMIAP